MSENNIQQPRENGLSEGSRALLVAVLVAGVAMCACNMAQPPEGTEEAPTRTPASGISAEAEAAIIANGESEFDLSPFLVELTDRQTEANHQALPFFDLIVFDNNIPARERSRDFLFSLTGTGNWVVEEYSENRLVLEWNGSGEQPKTFVDEDGNEHSSNEGKPITITNGDVTLTINFTLSGDLELEASNGEYDMNLLHGGMYEKAVPTITPTPAPSSRNLDIQMGRLERGYKRSKHGMPIPTSRSARSQTSRFRQTRQQFTKRPNRSHHF